MDLPTDIKNAVIRGHIDEKSPYPPDMAGQPGIIELVERALQENIEVGTILKKGLVGGMEAVGEKFSNGEYFLPDMLMSAQTMKAGMKLIEPLLRGDAAQHLGKVVIGTVKGDMHDIGKNLIAVILEGGGFEVIDLGIDVSPEKFVEQAQAHPEAIIGMSALLTTTRESMRASVDLIRESGLKNKIIVGGAVVTAAFADEIGADGYERDAPKAVPLVKNLLGVAG
ncbi:MAG: corrinoid protein [Fidelibacterota bacterium]|nr:MAG: corrinoid protein [Candidatus Neomarinimicrobiota bacterium]